MAEGVYLWLDDTWEPPNPRFVWAKTAKAAKDILDTNTIVSMSLDYDLGDDKKNGTGLDVANYVERLAHDDKIKPIKWFIHSANPVGGGNMRRALMRANDYWRKHEEMRQYMQLPLETLLDAINFSSLEVVYAGDGWVGTRYVVHVCNNKDSYPCETFDELKRWIIKNYDYLISYHLRIEREKDGAAR
ncbi:MAG: cyclic-phosphate processing receiver domain-containing protein [Candidatus Bathyarchaeia archaeon]|jgi:hypothetical protein